MEERNDETDLFGIYYETVEWMESAKKISATCIGLKFHWKVIPNSRSSVIRESVS